MATLEFKYSADQPHQIDAINAAVNLFRGQEFMDTRFAADVASGDGLFAGQVFQEGHANGIRLAPGQLERNLHSVQEENSLAPTSVTTDGRLRDFTIEMETGTGKTYVYIRTIFELNRHYGITKFIIVVPNVAIREGVLKSFRSMRSHFAALYDNAPMDYFVYDKDKMSLVSNFATSSTIQVMIINIDSFNKGYEDGGSPDSGNIFHRPSEDLPGGLSPRELVASCNPILIIDEPQSVDNTPKAKGAIKSLHPLFVLRYSATHKVSYNKVYRLTPVDAFQQNLVKGICVDSVLSQEDLNGSYVRLDSTSADPFRARITLDVRQKNGTQKRKAVTVKVGDDLFDKSGENSDYEDGWIISNISVAEDNEFVEFLNGEMLVPGQAVGDVAEEAVKRAQIRTTIEDHLQKQLELYPRGIKVLSLFFIDKVDRYRLYDPVRNGEYAQMFEEEYAAAVTSPKWKRRYEKHGIPLDTDASAVHTGYFSQDGHGKIKNTSKSASTAADISTFETIMQDKEALLSFPSESDTEEEHAKKRIQFIWSHSALKEGWDNPNVFQVCTLVETKETMTKRQKVGRGLRLCVDQNGERCYDEDANVLTVIANESYDAFARGLQSELEKDGFKFGVLSTESFTNAVIERDGISERIGFEESERIFNALRDENLVDSKGAITPELKEAAEHGSVTMPAGLESVQSQVEALILKRAQRLQIKNKAQEVEVELVRDVALAPAFQELWKRIRKRTRYEVSVDSDDLAKRAADSIKDMPRVRTPEVMAIRAGLDVAETGVDAEAETSRLVATSTERMYNLPDPIGEIQDVVGLTRATIKRILEDSGRFDEFKLNPAMFLSQVVARINKVKNESITDGIRYTKLPDSDWYTMSDLEQGELKAYLGQNAWKPRNHKSLYSYVVYDSATVEEPFAEELDQSEEVKVFAKLPSKFKIDTPLGSYNPDWAYVVEDDHERRVYFVVETKGGGNNSIRVSDSERTKIKCAKKHFEAIATPDLEYDVRTTYHVIEFDGGR